MEYVGKVSLHSYLKSQAERRMPEIEARRVFAQVVDAIRYCHSRSIVHRDIKLENILLDGARNAKVIDFGFAITIPADKKLKIFCGTPSYMVIKKLYTTNLCNILPPPDHFVVDFL